MLWFEMRIKQTVSNKVEREEMDMSIVSPRVLLSANTNKEFYIDAVEKCGGIAVAQYCPEFSSEYDGLLLCGGNDINPKYYNEDINGSVNIDDLRDAAEFELFRKFVEAKKPIFGVCRGCQLINVALGVCIRIFRMLMNTVFPLNIIWCMI